MTKREQDFLDEVWAKREEKPVQVGCDYVIRVLGIGEFHTVEMQTSAGVDMFIWMDRMIGYKGDDFEHRIFFRRADIAEAQKTKVNVFEKEFSKTVREFVLSTGLTEEQYRLRKR